MAPISMHKVYILAMHFRRLRLGGYKQVAKMLLEEVANVNVQGEYFGNALQAVSHKGHNQLAELLLNEGANVNAQGGRSHNALIVATLEDHGHLLQILLDKGANVST